MLIVADENIPLLDSFFGDIGKVRPVSGRAITPEDVRDADVLLVRSVTRVNQALLEGSRVKFVGTATIGTDHVDRDWLASQGISFAAAPGCNANSVVEYVLSLLCLWAENRDMEDWSALSVGIVGAGNVGGELGRKLERLGFTVKLCDPPRAEQAGEDAESFVSLEEALGCDVVTLHTPLTHHSDHPTYHMLDSQKLATLRDDQLLINTSRGEVIDGSALLERLEEGSGPVVALDVWEREPEISPQLATRCWIATPHIAGYSLEGKVQGSEMIYQALCRFLGLPVRKKAGQFLPEPPLGKLCFTRTAREMDAVNIAIHSCYDPRRDDARLRLALALPSGKRGAGFDRLRRDYPVRREFSSVKIQLKGTSRSLQDTFRALGFKLKL